MIEALLEKNVKKQVEIVQSQWAEANSKLTELNKSYVKQCERINSLDEKLQATTLLLLLCDHIEWHLSHTENLANVRSKMV